MPERGLVAAAVVAMALVACGGTAAPDATATSDLDEVGAEQLVAALCDAQAADTVAEADRRFTSGAHGPLHDLARAVVEVDRDVAARLHRTKQATEAALQAGDVEEIDANLAELTEATRTSLARLDQPTAGCADRSEP